MNEPENILNRVITAINNFCDCIDKIDEEENKRNVFEFLDECQRHISNLYLEMSSLPDFDTEYYLNNKELPENIDKKRLERFFYVLDKLKNMLGGNDLYWTVFDPYNLEKDDPSQSSLSNNIAEIYDDFKKSMDEFNHFEFTAKEKLDNLKSNFKSHWYDHACKALTALSWLLYNKND
ncbi:DUF5063 domain-containing protein [Bacteroidota bacterium]